jgi:hypothetical protein
LELVQLPEQQQQTIMIVTVPPIMTILGAYESHIEVIGIARVLTDLTMDMGPEVPATSGMLTGAIHTVILVMPTLVPAMVEGARHARRTGAGIGA